MESSLRICIYYRINIYETKWQLCLPIGSTRWVDEVSQRKQSWLIELQRIQDTFGYFYPDLFKKKVYQFGDMMIHFMSGYKGGWPEFLDSTEKGNNATLTPPLEQTRYMQGSESLTRRYLIRSTEKPLCRRHSRSILGKVGVDRSWRALKGTCR